MKTNCDCQRRSLAVEKKFWSRGFTVVIGSDEAGRGPLAGPVAAGAVAIISRANVLKTLKTLLDGVNDSKKLSPCRRRELYGLLTKQARIVWASGLASVQEIDRMNILQATKLAMERAINKIVFRLGDVGDDKIACVLDGNFKIDVDYEQISVVGGDASVFSIAAASIIAKVTRDNIMERLDSQYPGWGFKVHKGYPTPQHLGILARHQPTPVHRRSFSPVAQTLRRQA